MEVNTKDAQDNKAMGILAYLGILGLVLLIAEAAYGIAVAILSAIFLAISLRLWLVINTILGILWIAFAVWAILGIVNAAQGEMKPLPIIGGIKILK